MRRAVANAPPEVCKVAMAYDGYVTLEGTKYDAVFVEAGERGGASGVVFVQRYRPKGFLRAFSTIGNPAYIGDTDHPLSG
jgi:hypothetical protein